MVIPTRMINQCNARITLKKNKIRLSKAIDK